MLGSMVALAEVVLDGVRFYRTVELPGCHPNRIAFSDDVVLEVSAITAAPDSETIRIECLPSEGLVVETLNELGFQSSEVFKDEGGIPSDELAHLKAVLAKVETIEGDDHGNQIGTSLNNLQMRTMLKLVRKQTDVNEKASGLVEAAKKTK